MKFKKRMTLFFLCAIATVAFPVGLDIGLRGNLGASFTVGGTHVDNHIPITTLSDFGKIFCSGGEISFGVILTPNIVLKTGIGGQNIHRLFTTTEGNRYSNGTVSIQCFRLLFPIGVEYRIILEKNSVGSKSINISAGVGLSYLLVINCIRMI